MLEVLGIVEASRRERTARSQPRHHGSRGEKSSCAERGSQTGAHLIEEIACVVASGEMTRSRPGAAPPERVVGRGAEDRRNGSGGSRALTAVFSCGFYGGGAGRKKRSCSISLRGGRLAYAKTKKNIKGLNFVGKKSTLALVQSPSTSPSPPRKLGEHGLALWSRVHGEYNISDAGRHRVARAGLRRS